MGEFTGLLRIQRGEIEKVLMQGPAYIRSHWPALEALLNKWWVTYKLWEEHDTFDKAFKSKRMTVRTFAGSLGSAKKSTDPHPEITDDWGNKAFEKQKGKRFDTISLASKGTSKVVADSQYTRFTKEQQNVHGRAFSSSEERGFYSANRGIDGSAFANPLNFVDREKKYEMGLHDLSASLLNPDLSIFSQVHNNDWDAHFTFLPLSKEDDQLMLYTLTKLAKEMRNVLPAFYEKIRYYRAAMTRIKIASEFDMGTGYVAMPVANPQPGSPAYKLRYGLALTTTTVESDTTLVTRELYAARQQSALKFKSIIGKRDEKNEIIISVRQHAGNFPVYAVRQAGELKCYDIVGGQMVLNGKSISASGVMSG